MPKIICKKAHTEYFEQVFSGKKKFDLRVADFDCKEGDVIELVEIDDSGAETGRRLQKQTSMLLRTKDVNWYKQEDIEKYGFIVMSLEEEL